MKLTVIIPTWKRIDKFTNVLIAIRDQLYKPYKVLVVVNVEDDLSLQVAQSFQESLPLQILKARKSGVIHAENLAISHFDGDAACFIDDDAIPPRDWLEQINRHFQENPDWAAIGGADLILKDLSWNYRKHVDTVGKVCWYGKVIGNHHHQATKKMKVDSLKGVNMAVRAPFLSLLDEALQSEAGKGNGVYWELDLCLQIKQKGGTIYFDPALEVLHDSDHSHVDFHSTYVNSFRNLYYVLGKYHQFPQTLVHTFYFLFIGNLQGVGLAKFFHLLFVWGFKKSLFCLKHTWSIILNADSKVTIPHEKTI